MFIIFGWQTRSGSEGGVLDTKCYNCKNHANWEHYKSTDWISFFFIPTIPFRSKHYLLCGVCGDAIELDREEARGVGNLDRMDATDREDWREYLVERIEEHQFAFMSETQRNWHRERAE